MAKSDPRDFLLNTDYEMDKIIYFIDGEIGAGESKSFAHKLPFTPLVFGVCSVNSDFNDPRTLPFNETTPDNTISLIVGASATDVQIEYINYATNPPKMYYRIYGFEPSDSHSKVPSTSKHAGNFILNTDYNYCKLFSKGIVSGAGTHTVTHNLGYIPQVLAWGEYNGSTGPIEQSLPSDPVANRPQYIAVTNSNIIIVVPPSSYDRVHYRVYYDEG